MSENYICKDGICYLKPVKECKNFIVCQNHLDKDSINEICLDCSHIFNENRNRKKFVSVISELGNCNLCLDSDKIIVSRLDCEHQLCVDCFRKIYFGIEIKKPSLLFGIDYIYSKKLEKYNKIKELYLDFDKFSSKCFECKKKKFKSLDLNIIDEY